VPVLVQVVILLVLVVLLLGLLRAIDVDDLRRHPDGAHSPSGLRAIVGFGFVVGLVWGVLLGLRGGAPVWEWLGRGLMDGLIVACAGAFYVGAAQRRRRGRRPQ
jgi:hypothetical protein